jgi:TRAP-type C4-dicarboxylate transport system permease small subunit
MNYIKRIDDYLERIEKYIIIFLCSMLVLLVTANILSRNIINHSFEDLQETVPALVLWLSLAGSSLALKKRRHIKIEFLLRFCPSICRQYANYLVSFFGMGVMGLLFYSSVLFLKNEIHIFGYKGLFSIIFPLFFAISFFRYFTWMFRDCQQKEKA